MLHGLLDEDGRPLGEHGVRPRPEELRACPYDDRRRGEPMNEAALQQVNGQWPTVLALLGAAAHQEEPTLSGLWRATAGCVVAAPRAGAPVPRPLAALYKTALGLNQALLQILLARDGLAAQPRDALGPGVAFAAWCDREGLLFGARQVCAGSPSQIAGAWDALVVPLAGAPPAPLAVARSFADLQAAQLALMAETYQAQRRGVLVGPLGSRMLRERPFAWLDCPPERLPGQVARLYSSPPNWLDRQWSDESYTAVQLDFGAALPRLVQFLD